MAKRLYKRSSKITKREYANIQSIFKNPENQRLFGYHGGKKKTEKKDQSAIQRQSIEIQKAFSNGMIWFYKLENIFIRTKPGEFRFIPDFVKKSLLKAIPGIINKKDEKQMNKMSHGLSKVIRGIKLEFNELYLVGIITEPFQGNNFKLKEYYKQYTALLDNDNEEDLDISNKKKNRKSFRKLFSKFWINTKFKKISVWHNKKNVVIEVQPCNEVKNIVTKLGKAINYTYTDKEAKQFSALIKNEWIEKTRKGWTLI